jgi:hypothetical protein
VVDCNDQSIVFELFTWQGEVNIRFIELLLLLGGEDLRKKHFGAMIKCLGKLSFAHFKNLFIFGRKVNPLKSHK